MGIPLWQVLVFGWLAMAAMQLVLWLVQRARRDAGIVDAGWAFGLAALAVWYAVAADGDATRRVVVGVLGGVWGLRLAAYLFTNRVLGSEEDGRYQMLGRSSGERCIGAPGGQANASANSWRFDSGPLTRQ